MRTLLVHVDSVNALSQKVSEARNRVRNSMNREALYQEYRNGGTENPSAAIDLSWLAEPGKRFTSQGTSGTSNPFGSSSGSSSGFGSNPFASSTNQNSAFGSSVQSPVSI